MKKTAKIRLAAALVLVLLSACNSPGYLYYQDNSPTVVTKSQMVSKLASGVDIIWQVGGMTELQATLDAGATRFMTQLSQLPDVDWKLGVLSNLTGQAPILGFATPFDHTSPNPVTTFEHAVDYSVSNFDGEEEMDPIHDALAQYPSFVRPSAYLWIIMTNDNSDESSIAVPDFLTFLTSVKGGLSKVVSYGVLGSTDLGCNPNDIDEDWDYQGSTFQQVIQATQGKVYSLCTSDFGASLAKIIADFFTRVKHPWIYLDSRPAPSSIQVTYLGQSLPGGPQANGGLWYYDYSLNAIGFYNLDFTNGAAGAQTVQVTYTTEQ